MGCWQSTRPCSPWVRTAFLPMDPLNLGWRSRGQICVSVSLFESLVVNGALDKLTYTALEALVSVSSDLLGQEFACQAPLEMTRDSRSAWEDKTSCSLQLTEFPTPAPKPIPLPFLQPVLEITWKYSWYHSVESPRIPSSREGQVIGMELWGNTVSPAHIAKSPFFFKNQRFQFPNQT